MNPTPELRRLYLRMLNAFENDSGSPEADYRTIYLYNDGPGNKKQITWGRGFTTGAQGLSGSGSLQKVIARYTENGGARAKEFAAHSDLRPDDKVLLQLFRDVSTEQVMRDAQDEIFDEVYLQPAIDWATSYKFELPLSGAVIVDSFLHSGSMPKFLINRFPEKSPLRGGDEKKWIDQYVQARFRWLASHSRKILRNTVYRPLFFKGLIAKGNWTFDCPLVANDSAIC